MNSMLQCLSNVDPLREFFVSGAFEGDLNPDNPLGAEGMLAQSFASLLRLIWGNSASVVSPRSSHVCGKFAPQFAGYGQQDSGVLQLRARQAARGRQPHQEEGVVENFEAKGARPTSSSWTRCAGAPHAERLGVAGLRGLL